MRKHIVMLGVVVIMVLLLAACSGGVEQKQSRELPVIDAVFGFRSTGMQTGDLYWINEQESRKVASEMVAEGFVYLPQNRAILYADKENTLYYQTMDKERIRITDQVLPGSIILSEEENAMAYLRGQDMELYYQTIEAGIPGERIRMGMHIDFWDYMISPNGQHTLYINKDQALYLRTGSEAAVRVASSVSGFSFNSNEQIVYLNQSGDLYQREVTGTENKKLLTKPHLMNFSQDLTKIFYLQDYNPRNESGELFLLEPDKQPQWIASDVVDYEVRIDFSEVAFLNRDNNLYLKRGQNPNELIASEVTTLYYNDQTGTFVYITKDKGLYYINNTQQSQRVSDNIRFHSLTPQGSVYVNEDWSIYTTDYKADPVKIADKANRIIVAENNTSFMYEKDKDFYLVLAGQTQGKRVVSLSEYDAFFLGSSIAFQKNMTYQDIIGEWTDEYGFVSFTFSQNGTLVVDDWGDIFEVKATLNGQSVNSGRLIIEAYGERNEISIVLEDKDTMRFDGEYLYRVK